MSDFTHALIWALACLATIFLFRIVFNKGFKIATDTYKGIFWVYVILLAAYILFAAISVIQSSNPNFDWSRYVMLGCTVVELIWIGAWSSQARMDREDGIR